MRASILTLVATLAFAGVSLPASAQTTSAQQAPQASPSGKGEGTTSPSMPPATRQNVTESLAGPSQVDELSRDERRRLERLRAKAAASRTSDKPTAATPPPDKSVKPLPPASEQVKTVSPPAPRDKDRAAATDKDIARLPAPAPSTVRETDRAPASRPTRQAARRTHRPAREAADMDRRRSGPRAYPYRRGWPEVADRAPRVGDVVPPDTPLYPVPPGYVGRAYPPFPNGGEDAPPPRRFMPW